MILLKKLTLNNFLSHEKTEIDFSGSEKALIDGSSGAGKSSIFDAVLWVLYGEGRADNRSLIRKGTKRGSVCLELRRQNEQVDSEDVVIITRSTTAAGKHVLEVVIQESDGSRAAPPLSGVKEIQNWIDKELIGASYLLFINSIAYVQGSGDNFVSQTAPKRKELLLEIVKADDYKKYYENARQRLAGLDNDHSRLSGQILELDANLAALGVRLKGRSGYIKAITDNTALLAALEPKIKELDGKKAEMSALLKTVDILSSSLTDAETEKGAAELAIDLKKIRIADKPRLVKILDAVPGYLIDIEKTKEKLNSLREVLSSATEQEARRNDVNSRKPIIHDRTDEVARIGRSIAKIESEPVCPSGADCPYSGDHSKQIADLKDQIKACEKTLVDETNVFTEWSKEAATLPPPVDVKSIFRETGEVEAHLRNLESELSGIKSVQKDIDILSELEAEIPLLQKTLEEKISRVEEVRKQKEEAEKSAKIDEINTVDNDLLSARGEQKRLNDNIVRATAALEAIERDEKEIISLEERKTTTKTEMSSIQDKARQVGLVKEAFGSKGGVETMVIDYLLPKLEDKINSVLGKLSDFTIRLDTQKPSADGEGVVEGLWIMILNETGEELPYESYSGGEKVRITFAISEAFASLAQNRIGFRLVDEAVLALDENSLESFLEVVQTLLSDFSQVLFISHIQDVKDLFEKQIKVVKRGGISSVVDK